MIHVYNKYKGNVFFDKLFLGKETNFTILPHN
jgi:hypothetical protein